MMLWIKMAMRNLLRNRRRSTFTILAIGFGFAGVTLFGGFVHYLTASLRELEIYGRANGHMTLLKEGWDHAGATEEDTTFSGEELAVIKRLLDEHPAVIAVNPMMLVSGILSDGLVSSVCYGTASVPSTLSYIRGYARGVLGEFRYYEGESLEDDVPFGIGVSRGLMNALGVELGDSVVLAGNTASGHFNAVDCVVRQIFETTGDQSERFIALHLEQARLLRDADGAHRVGVLLRDEAYLPEFMEWLRPQLAEAGIEAGMRTWVEMSNFYRRVSEMFNVINGFNLAIVLIIAVMTVINTVSMSVMERTREIGTLRALGLGTPGVRGLFALESAMIGILGAALGLLLQLAGWVTVRVLEPTWVPPQINVEMPLLVYLVPRDMLISTLGVIILAVASALLASRKASEMEVVDALRHN